MKVLSGGKLQEFFRERPDEVWPIRVAELCDSHRRLEALLDEAEEGLQSVASVKNPFIVGRAREALTRIREARKK